MTAITPDPLLDYRQSDNFKIVLALYDHLHDAFCQEFGWQAAPEYSVDGLGQRLPNLAQLVRDPGLLLPAHNGWVHSPEWVAPLRLDEKLLTAAPDLEDEEATRLFVMEAVPVQSRSVLQLPVIENRIYGRAWTLERVRHFS